MKTFPCTKFYTFTLYLSNLTNPVKPDLILHMGTRKCEFCNQGFKTKEDSTICPKCDAQMEAEQNAEVVKLASVWGERHKCKDCHSPLPLGRINRCEFCRPQLGEESEFNQIGCLDVDASNKVVALSKHCKSCELEKPLNDFHKSRKGLHGRRQHCKSCTTIRLKVEWRVAA